MPNQKNPDEVSSGDTKKSTFIRHVFKHF